MSITSILLVDDDIDLLENTAYLVKIMGYEVLMAQDGYQAVDYYKENKPDLVIMDVKMPKMDGYEAFFKIKQFDPEAKIILITAYSIDEKKHLKAKSLGLLETLTKPYDFDKLENLIKQFV